MHQPLLAALLAPLLATTAFAAQAAGPAPSVLRNLPAFTAVHHAAPADVSIDIASGEPSVTLTGPSAFLNNVLVEVQNGEMSIRMKRDAGALDIGNAQVAVRMPQLLRYRLAGAGNTTIHRVRGGRLEVHLSGAGNLAASGEVGRLDLVLAGVGNVDAQALKAREVAVRLTGVGSARVRATDKLDAALAGVGSLTYYGNPKTVNEQVSGVGSLVRGD